MTLHGILNVNKPRGWPSFRVVSFVRRLSGQRRVGHAGTLDPEADGVLPVCVGQATRVVEYLIELPKAYRTAVRFGVETDTHDASGRVVAEADASSITEADVRRALPAFVGEVQQVPPMYSALKHRGVPLYRYAREGMAVERRPRTVSVYALTLVAYAPPVAVLDVDCGRGAYVRTLAHDLGRALGSGAHVETLTRTKVGPFAIEDAVTPDELEAAFAGQGWRDLLLPPDWALLKWPAAIVGEESERLLRHGQTLDLPETEAARRLGLAPGDPCRAYSFGGYLVAVLRYEGGHAVWRPEKVFSAPERGFDTPGPRQTA